MEIDERLLIFTLVWPYDAQRRLVWETGANTGFWIAAAQAIIFTVLALLAFSQSGNRCPQPATAAPPRRARLLSQHR